MHFNGCLHENVNEIEKKEDGTLCGRAETVYEGKTLQFDQTNDVRRTKNNEAFKNVKLPPIKNIFL